MSKPVYLKRVSAACRKERASLVAEAADYLGKHESDGKPPPVLMADMARAVVVPKVEAETAIIRQAGAPAGDEQEIEEILAGQEEAIEEAKQLETAKSINTVLAVFSEPTRELKAYGFTSCTN